MILIKLVKNMNTTIKQAFGKYYARPVVTQTIGIAELAEHMAKHNTPFSPGAITGVLTDMVACIKELVLQNIAVKIDNLAIFSIGIINKKGADSVKDWSIAKYIEGYRLRARATGQLSNAQLAIDTSAKNASSILGDDDETDSPTTPVTPGSDDKDTEDKGDQGGASGDGDGTVE
nr:DNA-binding protein [uncultured Prevotella sp.]